MKHYVMHLERGETPEQQLKYEETMMQAKRILTYGARMRISRVVQQIQLYHEAGPEKEYLLSELKGALERLEWTLIGAPIELSKRNV
jgi:hypothetical protein